MSTASLSKQYQIVDGKRIAFHERLDDPRPDSYSFCEHRRYLDGFLDQMELRDRVTLVFH